MSSNDFAVRVTNLSKRYEIYDTPRDRLKQFIAPRLQRMAGQSPKQYFRDFWALNDVSFEIKKGETIGIITTVLMFLSPVFYPVTAVPERFRPFIMANPLTFIIEQAREVLIWGHLPNWAGLSAYTLAAAAIAWAGYAWFQKTRKGFADVL